MHFNFGLPILVVSPLILKGSRGAAKRKWGKGALALKRENHLKYQMI